MFIYAIHQSIFMKQSMQFDARSGYFLVSIKS